jgi:hypothetical protein
MLSQHKVNQCTCVYLGNIIDMELVFRLHLTIPGVYIDLKYLI